MRHDTAFPGEFRATTRMGCGNAWGYRDPCAAHAFPCRRHHVVGRFAVRRAETECIPDRRPRNLPICGIVRSTRNARLGMREGLRSDAPQSLPLRSTAGTGADSAHASGHTVGWRGLERGAWAGSRACVPEGMSAAPAGRRTRTPASSGGGAAVQWTDHDHPRQDGAPAAVEECVGDAASAVEPLSKRDARQRTAEAEACVAELEDVIRRHGMQAFAEVDIYRAHARAEAPQERATRSSRPSPAAR